MPKQEHIDEIAGYLRSFEDGSRLHNQEHYHSPHSCGTAHCLAGWKAYDDAIAAGVNIDWTHYDGDNYGPWLESSALIDFISRESSGGAEGYAQSRWELTNDEGDSLFGAELTLDEMKEGLRAIADSHGLTCSI